ncbi:hypothetical protein BLNAU_7780 [Blattamonas nauphoetae]|uniref:Uncharacterized protein n=1 Tax=Blattamonas nauphoetae TaxID=2049346 RepID=A0ABQ9Y0D7_9EUKA|nr:hypothetical protein BLNAU_7780 [Blattamonas nauphoetae]
MMTDDLRQGCISLFDQVDSEMSLSQTEMNHAVRFLEYASIHINHRSGLESLLLKTIFRTEKDQHKRLATSLINLHSLPSDTLRTAALSFFNVGSSKLLSTSASDFFRTDHRSDSILLSTFRELNAGRITHHSRFTSSVIQPSKGGSRTEILTELASILGLPSSSEAERYLCFDRTDSKIISPWVKAFEYLIARVSEGMQFSDLVVEDVMNFVSRRPECVKIFFYSDDKFGLKVDRRIVSSSQLDTKSLWALFTPTNPHLSSTILNQFDWFMRDKDILIQMKHTLCGWLPNFINAVVPSKLPFTDDFRSFHKNLVSTLRHQLHTIRLLDHDLSPSATDLRRELDEAFLSFFKHTKEYIIHLSLHPFSLDEDFREKIIDFFVYLFQYRYENNVTKTFGKEMRKNMDEAALSSPSPPFILTSELVFCLTDKEILNVVDRMVSLLDSNSPLDDDTVLSICMFHKLKLKSVYLPKLFRKFGRTTKHFLHTFESLLSLHIDFFPLRPIYYLLRAKPHKPPPTFGEWEDVDLATVGVVMRMINQNNLPIASCCNSLEELIRAFVVESLPQARHSAARLNQPQLEQLLAPSIDFITNYLVQPSNYDYRQEEGSLHLFVDICELCDQRVIARCLGRIGFFSRVVTGLFNESFIASQHLFELLIRQPTFYRRGIVDLKMLRRPIPCFLEEGWHDASEFIFIQAKNAEHDNGQYGAGRMLHFFGTNMDR